MDYFAFYALFNALQVISHSVCKAGTAYERDEKKSKKLGVRKQ